MTDLRSPYPYFGGKSRIADLTWRRLGDPRNFLDPFYGSNAFLLKRPHWNPATGVFYGSPTRIETINDANGFLANFWRATREEPEEVAKHADNPVNEADMHARHKWLMSQAIETDFLDALVDDPDYYDTKIAGWWVWGACCWIGKGWCDLNKLPSRQVPHIGGTGRGVNSLSAQRPHLSDSGTGVHKQRPHITNTGHGVHAIAQPYNEGILEMMKLLSLRMRYVRVCCGDWSRILGPSVTTKLGTTAIVLDPPYNTDLRDGGLYAVDDDDEGVALSTEVREWAIEHGDDELMRIAMFGYEDEHGPHMPDDWECVAWKATGGYGSQRKDGTNDNPDKERVWFSPHCIYERQLGLFEE